MIPVLLIAVPLVAGLLAFLMKDGGARGLALFASLLTLVVAIWSVAEPNGSKLLEINTDWISGAINSRFALSMDGLAKILCLLTAISFPVIFISTWGEQYRKAKNFFGLMLLSQAGMLGVFLAADALLFYFFWEIALVPVYFLASQWGGERRIQATFKFFVYTFFGSLMMLIAIIYIAQHNHDHSFSLGAFYSARGTIKGSEQTWLFWLMFLAFAIKMPIFPFHTWQPDTYEQAPAAVTMVLSGVMVKMGIYGLIRWLAPVLNLGTYIWGDTVSALCITGMIYASLIALRQDDLKRLVAYSSIAHMGLMCLAVFATTESGMQGVMIQIFNHGINIIGLWVIVYLIEKRFHTRKISELGGMAEKSPALTAMLVIVALANIALPLTNGFVGEFLMFTGVYGSKATTYNVVFTVTAALTIILAAVYMLNMVQKVCYGGANKLTEQSLVLKPNEKMVLVVIVILILLVGVYPDPLLQLTRSASESILAKMNFNP
ncbi:MAG TPA: NADH-quinone oxidoreductase subunit M [Puia sp.]|nr:NADH-quinone oxidoreductase subunit M [Puia sp.]